LCDSRKLGVCTEQTACIERNRARRRARGNGVGAVIGPCPRDLDRVAVREPVIGPGPPVRADDAVAFGRLVEIALKARARGLRVRVGSVGKGTRHRQGHRIAVDGRNLVDAVEIGGAGHGDRVAHGKAVIGPGPSVIAGDLVPVERLQEVAGHIRLRHRNRQIHTVVHQHHDARGAIGFHIRLAAIGNAGRACQQDGAGIGPAPDRVDSIAPAGIAKCKGLTGAKPVILPSAAVIPCDAVEPVEIHGFASTIRRGRCDDGVGKGFCRGQEDRAGIDAAHDGVVPVKRPCPDDVEAVAVPEPVGQPGAPVGPGDRIARGIGVELEARHEGRRGDVLHGVVVVGERQRGRRRGGHGEDAIEPEERIGQVCVATADDDLFAHHKTVRQPIACTAHHLDGGSGPDHVNGQARNGRALEGHVGNQEGRLDIVHRLGTVGDRQRVRRHRADRVGAVRTGAVRDNQIGPDHAEPVADPVAAIAAHDLQRRAVADVIHGNVVEGLHTLEGHRRHDARGVDTGYQVGAVADRDLGIGH